MTKVGELRDVDFETRVPDTERVVEVGTPAEPAEVSVVERPDELEHVARDEHAGAVEERDLAVHGPRLVPARAPCVRNALVRPDVVVDGTDDAGACGLPRGAQAGEETGREAGVVVEQNGCV